MICVPFWNCNAVCDTYLTIIVRGIRGPACMNDIDYTACKLDSHVSTVIKEETLGTLMLSQCTLAGSVYTGMPLECHWLTQCALEHHWKNLLKQPHTGMPLEKLSWIRPTLGSHWRNSNFCSLHWNTTGGLWQPTHAPTQIVKHAE